MTYRIITHAGCTDGFCSAFVFKRYWQFFVPELTAEDIATARIVQAYPKEIQAGEIEITEKDIVLDLPKPAKDVFFWCDHHASNKQTGSLPDHHYFKLAPSCAGFLLDLALSKGLETSEELLQFKRAIDQMDNAEYTKEDILACFYPQADYANPSPIQKLCMIGAMFHTRDKNLNQEIFNTLLVSELGETPLSSKGLWQLRPLMFHRAQLIGYQEWRDLVDTYMYLDETAKCVVQDDRKVSFSRGVADRFYCYIKYPETSYNISLKQMDEVSLRIGLGSNIFHRERCKVDIGKLCSEVGKRFGGAGGGHPYVGGVSIPLEQADAALQFILDKLKEK